MAKAATKDKREVLPAATQAVTGMGLLLEAVASQAWAMERGVLERMLEIVERHVMGVRLDAAQIEAATASRKTKQRDYEVTADGRAIIPVTGVIAKYARMVNGVSQPQGSSIEQMRQQLAAALNDTAVRSLFLLIESPGGSVSGLADFAAEVRAASERKPVVAMIDDLGASAAYYLASQAQVLYANASAMIGSVGVYSVLVDSSKRAEAEGLTFHILKSGEHKGTGTPGVAISSGQLAQQQTYMEHFYGMFIAAVLAGRAEAGLTAETLYPMADGRLWTPQQALESSLIDGVMSVEEALQTPLPSARATINNNSQRKGSSMSDETAKAEETPQATADQVQAAQQAERQRIQAISKLLADDTLAGVRDQAIADGMSLTEAKAAAFEVLQKARADERVSLQAEIDQRQQRLDAIAQGGIDVEAQEPADAGETGASLGTSADDGRAETYANAVRQLQTQGLSEAQAYEKAVRLFPTAHEAWKDANAVEQRR